MFRRAKKPVVLLLVCLFLFTLLPPAVLAGGDAPALPPELDNMLIIGSTGISIDFLRSYRTQAAGVINEALAADPGSIFVNLPGQFLNVRSGQPATETDVAWILGNLLRYYDADGNQVKPPDETANDAGDAFPNAEAIELEAPAFEGAMSVEEALATRVSRRRFAAEPLSIRELSQVLWAAYGTGIDGETGATRTVPSAGGVYFLEIFIITASLEGGADLPAGIYQYDWQKHRLIPKVPGDQRPAMAQTSSYGFIEQAPVSIILAVDFQRAARFQLGERYASMEIGYATQNIHLQAEALGLGSVAVAGFDASRLKALLETEFEPMIIIPVGRT